MTIIPAAIDLITASEGCKLTAYPDGNGILTVGFGHTGPEVVAGLTITQEQANDLLATDLQEFDDGVTRLCPSAAPEQHGAMCSLAYNIGLRNFGKSSVCRYHNAGQFSFAASSFALWNKIAGVVSNGLVTRRAAEAELYMSGTNGGVGT